MKCLSCTLCIAGSQILTDKGCQYSSNRHDGNIGKRHHFCADTVCRYGNSTIVDDIFVHDDKAQIFKKLAACGRYTKLQYDFSIRCMKRICPKIDMYRKGFIMQTPPCNRYHNQLGYNRGNRSTKDTEVKNKNEYRIQNSIQQGSAHIQLYTGSAVPRTLSHCHIEVQHKKADIVKGNSEQILITGIINFLRGIQPA